MNIFRNRIIILSILFLKLNFIFAGLAHASSESTELSTVHVLGQSEAEVIAQPHSGHKVSSQTLEQQQQTDVNRVLKQISGVYVQEEDAFGLRPNIGFRGTHPHRSRKVVFYEDQILIGPAPYSAPAAYYTPYMGRIANLEVFKGVASVIYGPNSIGGALNYVTEPIPLEPTTFFDVTLGSFQFQKYTALTSINTSHGDYLIKATHLKTDGFKQLETGKTGFDKNDILVKGRHLISEYKNQILNWKYSFANENSKETYLGLSLEDFYKTPNRRYVASEKDNMVWDQQQMQIEYKIQPTVNSMASLTTYHHQFHRNWTRLNGFRNGNLSIRQALNDVGSSGLNQLNYQVLTGQADSSGDNDLEIVENNRYFFSRGIQTQYLFMSSLSEKLSQQTEFMYRLHQDQIQRRHFRNFYAMRSGRLESLNQSQASDQNQDLSFAKTYTLQNELKYLNLKTLLALRYEDVEYKTKNNITSATDQFAESAFVPGVSFQYSWTENQGSFIGWNKGLTLVGPNRNDSQKPEESTQIELGHRYSHEDSQFFLEGIIFATDYKNIKGVCSFSSGCTNSQSLDQEYDGGQAEIRGLELNTKKVFSFVNIQWPIGLSYTRTLAKFKNSIESTNPEWGVGLISSNDPLPYVPESNYNLSIGAQTKKWSQEVIFNWTGEAFDQSTAFDTQISQSRVKIPAYGVVDWSGRIALTNKLTLHSRIDNLFDKTYLVSMRPFGARPGKERSFQLGLKYAL